MIGIPNTEAVRSAKTQVCRGTPPTFQMGLEAARLSALRSKMAQLSCTASSAVRSFLGHLRSYSAKGHPSVDFGPALRRLPDGSLQPENRTIARSDGIDILLAKYPWADCVDARIFLAGFDAGERFGLDSRNSGSREDTDVASA